MEMWGRKSSGDVRQRSEIRRVRGSRILVAIGGWRWAKTEPLCSPAAFKIPRGAGLDDFPDVFPGSADLTILREQSSRTVRAIRGPTSRRCCWRKNAATESRGGDVDGSFAYPEGIRAQDLHQSASSAIPGDKIARGAVGGFTDSSMAGGRSREAARPGSTSYSGDAQGTRRATRGPRVSSEFLEAGGQSHALRSPAEAFQKRVPGPFLRGSPGEVLVMGGTNRKQQAQDSAHVVSAARAGGGPSLRTFKGRALVLAIGLREDDRNWFGRHTGSAPGMGRPRARGTFPGNEPGAEGRLEAPRSRSA